MGGNLARYGAALVAVGPLKERVNHEVDPQNTQREKNIERHRFVPQER
jgi:hypothetical protein